VDIYRPENVRMAVSLADELGLVERLLVEYPSRAKQIEAWQRLTSKSQRTFELRLRVVRAAG